MEGFGRVPTRSRAFRAAVATIVAGLVIATALWAVPAGAPRPSPSPTPSGAAASVAPSPGAPESAGPTSEPWGPVALGPEAAIADLVATRSDTVGVAPDTAFLLTSRSESTAADLVSRLEVSPPVSLSVAPGTSPAQAVIRPAAALVAGTSYRFRLRSEGGAVAAAWVFRAKTPLHIVSTIPVDTGTDVPVRTGIEALFDQDGIVGYEGHVRIEPAVPFRIELHSRTLAIVPLGDLAPRTLYTVTIARGIRVTGSDVTLEHDAVIRFETGGPKSTGPNLGLATTLREVVPGEVPVIPVDLCCDVGSESVQHVDVYRLPTLDAAISAARTLATGPTWASWSDGGLVPTAGLAVATRFDATMHPDRDGSNTFVLRFPAALPAGRYLVVLPREGRDGQFVLQVTRIAAFTEVSTTHTVAWANDAGTGLPVSGATIALTGGPTLGRTDATGLLVADTPASLVDALTSGPGVPPAAIVTRAADGDVAFSLVGMSGDWRGYGSDPWNPSAASSEYWLAFGTDRYAYRTADRIEAWGIVRARDRHRIATAELRLVPEAAGADVAAPPIVRATVSIDANGAFAGSLPIVDLPIASYQVLLVVEGRLARATYVRVDEVRKPAYSIELTTDRHVLIAGDTFKVTARAAYLDGTPVPGLELVFGEQGGGRHATTGVDGRVTLSLKALMVSGVSAEVTAQPVRPEEGSVAGAIWLSIYSSSVWPTVTASLTGTTLDVAGRVQVVDVAGLERIWDTETQTDPGGAAVPGTQARVSVVQVVTHQEETGREYDWISKQTVPTYRTWTTDSIVASRELTTGSDGRVTATVRVPDPRGDYSVRLETTDPRERIASAQANAGIMFDEPAWGPDLQVKAGATVPCCDGYAVGERVELTVARAVPAASPTGRRFLFITARQGIREAVVRDSSAFDRTFAASDVPNVSIHAVEFTGRNLVFISGYDARLRVATRELQVSLTTDAASYRPGADVRVGVRTLAPDGTPVAASVVIQAVDEKFKLMGAASEVEPLSQLYVPVPSGVLWSRATLALAYMPQGGDTTGGGGGGDVRTEFADTLLFRRVTTDSSGRASLTFRLSDDLTSWRLSAGAVDASLRAGNASKLVPVGLPFFIDATIAPEFVRTDHPVLRLRAYGSALKAGQKVTFSVAAPNLGLTKVSVDGTAFQSVRVTLPDLTVGTHELRIDASTVGRSPALRDALVRTIRVVASRYQETSTAFAALDASFAPQGGTGFTTYTVTDAGRASVLPILDRLAWADGGRLDQVLSAAVARDLLVKEFDRDPADVPVARFDAAAYMKEAGLALLPYASGDLGLTAQVALAAPERFDQAWLRDAVQRSIGDAGSTTTRERGIIGLAALAALGDPVIGRLGLYAALPDLTVRERLYLGLAYAHAGDDGSARRIERSLLSELGRASGPWVRLEGSPDKDEIVEATGLLAVLSAAIGDPLGDRAQAYVEANPPRTTLQALEEIAFVKASLDRLSASPARFAYTIDGDRKVVDLPAGESFTLTLTPAQRATFRLERLTGELSVATSWSSPARPGARAADPDVSIERTVKPGTTIGETQVVRVHLRVRFTSTASDGCYEVVERVPSGLAPLEGGEETNVVGPYAIAGQLVRFCMSRDQKTDLAGYTARVVSPGTYTWEPATVASSVAADRVSLTAASVLTIR